MAKQNRREFLVAAMGMSSMVAGNETGLAKVNGGENMCSRFGVLAKLSGPVVVIGLLDDEVDRLFDGKTCVHTFKNGVMFYDGPEHYYTRPPMFVGPDGEPEREPNGFASEWEFHELGKDFSDWAFESDFRESMKS